MWSNRVRFCQGGPCHQQVSATKIDGSVLIDQIGATARLTEREIVRCPSTALYIK